MTKRAAVFALLVTACSAPAPAKPPKPRLELLAPPDFLTNDLDFVIRVDARRLRGDPEIH